MNLKELRNKIEDDYKDAKLSNLLTDHIEDKRFQTGQEVAFEKVINYINESPEFFIEKHLNIEPRAQKEALVWYILLKLQNIEDDHFISEVKSIAKEIVDLFYAEPKEVLNES